MVVESQFNFLLPFPRKEVWAVLRQTDWVNRSLGLPPVTYQFFPRPEGGARVIAEARWAGMRWRWQEFPFQWVEEEYYSVERRFEAGPVSEMHLKWEFREEPGPATAVKVSTAMVPRHPLARWVVSTLFPPKLRRDIRKMVGHFQSHLEGKNRTALPNLPQSPIDETAFAAALAELRKSPAAPGLAARFEKFLRESNDLDLAHIRPFAVANLWGEDRWEVLRLFLWATRAGLLNFSWEILCPNCRTAPQRGVFSLGELKNSVHCDACQIRFDGEFDRSVELKFAVHPAIKTMATTTFCLAGPGTKPHIIFQRILPPQSEEALEMPPLRHACRLRSPQVRAKLEWSETGEPGPISRIRCDPGGFEVQIEEGARRGPALRVVNPNPYPVQLIGERSDWPDDILTAARATNWQEFRDLFSAEVISPAEQITVGAQVILFTDLKGSTAMYSRIGDGSAYALVRAHFAILIEALSKHHGSLIKTIGDAIMAGFCRLDEALLAVEEMHRRLAADLCREGCGEDLLLKSSLHIGPCLAVNANDKLDFFGSSVNLAARLVECCHGGDLAVTESVYERPETRKFLATIGETPQLSEVRLKGFDKPFRVWLIPVV